MIALFVQICLIFVLSVAIGAIMVVLIFLIAKSIMFIINNI